MELWQQITTYVSSAVLILGALVGVLLSVIKVMKTNKVLRELVSELNKNKISQTIKELELMKVNKIMCDRCDKIIDEAENHETTINGHHFDLCGECSEIIEAARAEYNAAQAELELALAKRSEAGTKLNEVLDKKKED